jgi:8-oxo-dGTP pyrophosphatase MutT (NUDIX family)
MMATFLKRVVRLGRWLTSWRHPVVQAGGIVFRSEKGEPRVLIVTARRRRKRWILPKGTVEEGEEPSEAALREVREEAGVTGTIVRHASTVRYNTRRGRVQVEYYLIRYRRAVDGGDEERRTLWCAVEDAIRMLTYASARRVLLEAHPLIVKNPRR